jgi:hypothetical protein
LVPISPEEQQLLMQLMEQPGLEALPFNQQPATIQLISSNDCEDVLFKTCDNKPLKGEKWI